MWFGGSSKTSCSAFSAVAGSTVTNSMPSPASTHHRACSDVLRQSGNLSLANSCSCRGWCLVAEKGWLECAEEDQTDYWTFNFRPISGYAVREVLVQPRASRRDRGHLRGREPRTRHTHAEQSLSELLCPRPDFRRRDRFQSLVHVQLLVRTGSFSP